MVGNKRETRKISVFKSISRFSLIVGFFSVALCQGAFAQSDESKIVRDSFIFGQCIHLGFEKNKAYASPVDVEMKLSQLGITSTRDDLFWDIRKATSLQTIPSTMSHIAYSLNNIQARPLLILTGNRRLIPEGQPSSVETRTAFAEYAAAAAHVLKEVNPIFEIWNEWNLAEKKSEGKEGSPENYVELAKATYPEIKKIMPDGVVLAGAVGDDEGWRWTQRAVKLGLMRYADGLSVHVYNHCMKMRDRTGDEVIGRLEDLHKKLKVMLPHQDIPIYLTEYGWPNMDGKCGGVPEDRAAANMAQFLLAAPAYPWLKGAWHYELLDRGVDPENREHHFGQFRPDGTIKPSGCVAKTVWAFIADQRFIEKRKLRNGAKMVVYGNNNERRIAVWQAKDEAAVFLRVPNGAESVSLCGEPIAASGKNNKVRSAPYLIKLPSRLVSRIEVE